MVEVGTYFLTSERLGFRRWSEGDLELAFQLWGDPAVTRWIDARGALSRDEVLARLRAEIATERATGVQYWPIFSTKTGAHVGCCGLHPYPADVLTYEIGFHIIASCWGHGYATEAARTTIRHAFDTLNAEALFAGHNPNNDGSRKLLSKLGFRYLRHEFYAPTGLEHPSYELRARDR